MTTNKIPLEVLLKAMEPVVWPTLRERFRADCCVAACRILREVFADYGYRAQQVPMQLFVFNAPMRAMLDAKTAFPDDPAERTAFFDEHGAWSVGIGPHLNDGPLKPDGYRGHLVLNVEGVLVDPSLQQAQRAAKGILLPLLLWFQPHQGFFAKPKGQRTSGMIGDCLVAYRRIRDDSYLTGRNWREKHAGVPETYFKIARLVREQIAGKEVLV
jgi:hypothetical protein